jgi:NAD(P)-dependent dehydrogenase (short-subunit alcohol dehydrogenase family)
MSTRPIALVTGAAGGLGSAIAVAFHNAGYDLYLSDRNESGLSRVSASLSSGDRQVHAALADMSCREQILGMVDRAVEIYGRIDVLVNNAAVSETRSFWELTEQDWDTTLAINVKGVFFAMQAAAAHMPSGSSVVNIASVAGRVGRPTLLHYAASKAAVISITRSAAAALADRGIRVNAVAPGMIDTAMLHNLQRSWKQTAEETDAAEPTLKSSLLQRVAQPEEVAATVLFLAGEGSAYITGQTLNVCGGIVMS